MPAQLTNEALLVAIREVVREEVAAAMPRLKQVPDLLTIRECAKKYRRGYDTIARMARKGQLMSIDRPHGDVVHVMIVAADAARKLGGE